MSAPAVTVREDGAVCWIRMEPRAGTVALSDGLVQECAAALDGCERWATAVVLEGTPEVFCVGADFAGLAEARRAGRSGAVEPAPLYDLWRRLATGPFVSIAHVRGRANAGGMGFVAACDLVLADAAAQFSLSELLFGLYPACVLPFLHRRIGFQRSQYLTLTTQPVSAERALGWGLVDACETPSGPLVHRHLVRLRRLSKEAVARHKAYAARLWAGLDGAREEALAANREMFSDPRNLAGIARYVEEGKFPWEA